VAKTFPKSPSTQELTSDQNFGEAVGSLPNPDPILRSAGIAESTYQEMMFDPQIFSAFQKRKRKINKLKYRIEGDDETVNEIIKETIDKLDMNKLITGMLRAIPLGYAVSELIWEVVDGSWTIIEIKNRNNKKFKFNTLGEMTYQGEEEEEIAPYGKFVLHRNDFEDDGNPYGTSLNARCYWYWRFKKHGWKIWGQYLEKFGDPALVMKTTETNDDKITEQGNQLDSVAGGSNIVIGIDESVDALTVSSGNVDYNEYTEKADKQISKIYLGSSMLMDETTTGTYATAVEHGDNLSEITFSDATSISETIRVAIIEPLVRFNLGEDKDVPYFVLYDDTGLDEEDETQTDSEKGTGVKEEDSSKKTDPKKEKKTDKKKEESKNTIEEEEEKLFFSDELTVEQFSELPKYKQVVETLAINLHKTQLKVFKKINSLDEYSGNPKKAILSLQDKYESTTEDLAENISYALFFVSMYAKHQNPKRKDKFTSRVKEMFKSSDIEDAVIQSFEQARATFANKVPLTDDEFRKLTAMAKSDAFAMASIKSKQVVNALKSSLEDAILNGTSEQVWKNKARTLLNGYGLNPSPAHLGNVYRTNIFSSYAKANYAEYKTITEEFPAMMYDSIGDNRTRPAHLALDGQVFLADDEIWNSIYPPNGFNCRCSVIPMSVKKLKKVKIAKGKDFKGSRYAPDSGWNFHGGKGIKEQILQKNIADGLNSLNFEDYGLSAKLTAVKDPLVKKHMSKTKPNKKRIKEDTLIQDATGSDTLIKKGSYESLEITESVITKPEEVWLKSKKTSSGNLGYELNFVKAISVNGTERSYLVTTDGFGNYIGTKQVANNSHRKGVPIMSLSEEVSTKLPDVDLGNNGDYNHLVKGLNPKAVAIINKYPIPKIRDGKRPVYYYQDGIENSVIETVDRREVLLHEYGHHIDAVLDLEKKGVVELRSATNTKMTDAIASDKKTLALTDEKLQKYKDDYYYTNKEGKLKIKDRKYMPISDVIDALSEGRFRDKFRVAGHGAKIFGEGDAFFINSETFANMFSVWADGEKWAELKKIAPKASAEFERTFD